ncbi:hypothetical protein AALP_AA6G202300 [Arabis alpina]|uniref:Uncharacterized protein n=1 Tax=Arabis alpina TaxID=50452 RepID=A0A087GQH9_ARAAL|nr:hypothetical protein AALP_AA6G202300 [Arabis alpina]
MTISLSPRIPTQRRISINASSESRNRKHTKTQTQTQTQKGDCSSKRKKQEFRRCNCSHQTMASSPRREKSYPKREKAMEGEASGG